MTPKQKQKAESSGMSSTKTSEKDDLVQARAIKRAERVVARYTQAEERKEAGNAQFRAGHYRKAIKEYDGAIKIHGPSAAYLSNMAAAWLKLEEYDAAERCADRALVLDPCFAKARYRRGLARQGNLELARAAIDFETVLTQNPDSTEAKEALHLTMALMIKRGEEEDPLDESDEAPMLEDTKVELESVSDSTDWNHEGNGIPCRFYNHDGCLRGADCRFSHAPDHKSVRDRLGRNVCMYFLLGNGNCKFGSSTCVYSHDKTYLPSGRWWDDKEKLCILFLISDSLDYNTSTAFMPHTFALIDNRLGWTSAHGVEMEELYGHSRSLAMLGLQSALTNAQESLALSDSEYSNSRHVRGSNRRGRGKGKAAGRRGRRIEEFEEFDSEQEERMANFGFTHDDVMELAMQGVKPWDEDAWDVLDALNSL